MIRAILSVVLNYKNSHLFPVLGSGTGFYDLSERDIIGGYRSLGRERTGSRSAGMIFTERHDHEPGERVRALELFQLLDKHIRFFEVSLIGGARRLPPFACVSFKARDTVHTL